MTLLDASSSSRPLRTTTRLSAAVESATSLDAVAEPLGSLTQRMVGEGRRRSLLSGTWLGHPVHPLVVAVPIGAWTSASVLDLLGQRKAARTLIGLGLLTAPVAVATGASDWAYTTGAERRIGLAHLTANTAATMAYTRSWRLRGKGRHGAGAVWALAGAAAAGAGGWLGGHLAYALGVGVDTNAFDAGPRSWTPLEGEISASGPAEGAMIQASAGGTAVLVTRSGGTVRALADRCSHRGGPLSGGELAGGCVTCPWHASRFDVANGEVVEGPAVVGQPTFELRAVDGGWQVRREEARSLRTNAVGPLPGGS